VFDAHISIVPAPKKDGEDQAIGRSRGGLTTKIHAAVGGMIDGARSMADS